MNKCLIEYGARYIFRTNKYSVVETLPLAEMIYVSKLNHCWKLFNINLPKF